VRARLQARKVARGRYNAGQYDMITIQNEDGNDSDEMESASTVANETK